MFECEIGWDIDNNQDVLNSGLFESAEKTSSKSTANDGWKNIGKKKKRTGKETSGEKLKQEKIKVPDSTDFDTQVVPKKQLKSERDFDRNNDIVQSENEKTIENNQCDINMVQKTGVKKVKPKKQTEKPSLSNENFNQAKLPSNDSISGKIDETVLKKAKSKKKRKKIDIDKDTQGADSKVLPESSAVDITVSSEEMIDDAAPKKKRKKKQKKCAATGDGNINQTADVNIDSSTVAKKKRKKLDVSSCEETVQTEGNNNCYDVAQDTNEESTAFSAASSSSNISSANDSVSASSSKKRDKFQARLERRMAGGQFRWLNERLYTQPSDASEEMFRGNADLFRAYHTGFQEQVHTWPSNPVDVFIERLGKRVSSLIIADIGCGDAKLSQSIAQHTFSFDLVALNDRVTVCDMAALPLKNNCVDVAIFCLSLMGTNISDFLAEAYRILKPDGVLWVAEVASRFDEPKTFMEQVSACGFDPVRMDDNNKMFVLFEFVKSAADVTDLSQDIRLKPCVYKRR